MKFILCANTQNTDVHGNIFFFKKKKVLFVIITEAIHTWQYLLFFSSTELNLILKRVEPLHPVAPRTAKAALSTFFFNGVQ